MTYTQKKERALYLAIDWQLNNADKPHSWHWYFEWTDRFYRIGKKYGLLREFKENGIL